MSSDISRHGHQHYPGSRLKRIQDLPFLLKLLGTTTLYVLLSELALAGLSLDGVTGVFWLAGGWALAVLLVGGRRYGWGVLAGEFLSLMLAGSPPLASLGCGIGATTSLLLGHWLLTHDSRFGINFRTMGDYLRLIAWAVIPISTIRGLVSVASLTASGVLAYTDNDLNLLHWWIGDALSLTLLPPLLLVWRRPPVRPLNIRLWSEAVLILMLTLLFGQVLFLDWFADTLGQFPFKGYWMLPLILWAAFRLGIHSVLTVLCFMTVQVLAGVQHNTGFFANEDLQTRLLDSWFFLVFSSMTGIFLTMHVKQRRRAEAGVRIAATAFECQEGMIITDADMRILRTNHSFSRIMGYSNEEVVGKTTAFMRSDRHPPSFYEAAWATARRVGSWHDEVWHKRKNGEVFPQWLTSTAVTNERGDITNYVVTHTDITLQKLQESKRLAAEAAHREALVREVHHRIKNNLQGITGMLRQFAQDHPETAEPLYQAIGQVRSVAVIHGLQGNSSLRAVRLCELTSAIASDIESLWQVRIHVDLPAIWRPGVLAETEAVPIALVLNELILNAVKHGGKAHGEIKIQLRQEPEPEAIRVSIINTGQWRTGARRSTLPHNGLQLIEALLPRSGARLSRQQLGPQVETLLELESPVITFMSERPA